jgi:sulfonate transport system ATP-binding protein
MHDLAEAVALADRVLLVEQGRLTLDGQVVLERPRERGSAAVAKIEGRVLSRVLGEASTDSERIRPAA